MFEHKLNIECNGGYFGLNRSTCPPFPRETGKPQNPTQILAHFDTE